MNQFYVGQQVVCIDAGQAPNVSLPCELTEGALYRIRWLNMFDHYVDGIYLGVRLFDLDRGICQEWGYKDVPFRASRFRPLVEDTLAVFRNMAAPVPPSERPYAPRAPVRKAPAPERVKEDA